MFTLYGNICGDRVGLGRAMHKPTLFQKDLAEKVQRLGMDMTIAIVSRIEKGERRHDNNLRLYGSYCLYFAGLNNDDDFIGFVFCA